MSNNHETPSMPLTVNASVVALVIFLCGALYFFGHAMSGDTNQISKSVAGAEIIDSREVAN